MNRRHLFIPPWVVVAFGAVACSADSPVAPRAGPPSAGVLRAPSTAVGSVNVWTLILTDMTGDVWVAQTDTGSPIPVGEGEWAGSAALWSRLDSVPDASLVTLRTTIVSRLGPVSGGGLGGLFVSWQLGGSGTAWTAAGGGRRVWDRRQRTWRCRGGAVVAAGGASGALERVKFDLIADTPMPPDPIADPTPRGSVVVRTPAVVSLRIDGCMAADAVAFALLQKLRLTVEMAAPSRRIDRRGHCSQQLLEEMVAAGDLVESHSRFHGPAPASFGDFYLETVGSAQDLRRRGFNPFVFIPPGSWRSRPTLMDSPGKLVGPYAELLRRVYVSTQSYALPSVVPVPISGRDGPSSAALKWFTIPVLEERLRQAVADSQWLSFMWHAWDMTPADLEARLRVIAALRDSGLVTVLPYYTALHAARQRKVVEGWRFD